MENKVTMVFSAFVTPTQSSTRRVCVVFLPFFAFFHTTKKVSIKMFAQTPPLLGLSSKMAHINNHFWLVLWCSSVNHQPETNQNVYSIRELIAHSVIIR